jgi:hypothetical protein
MSSSKAYADSDSEDEFDEENAGSLLLGVPDGVIELGSDLVDPMVSRIGGTPVCRTYVDLLCVAAKSILVLPSALVARLERCPLSCLRVSDGAHRPTLVSTGGKSNGPCVIRFWMSARWLPTPRWEVRGSASSI